MNQADYKAIAEIIDRHIKLIVEMKKAKMGTVGLDNSITSAKTIAHKLADYFEKEYKFGITYPKDRTFNRNQFLKECGVTE